MGNRVEKMDDSKARVLPSARLGRGPHRAPRETEAGRIGEDGGALIETPPVGMQRRSA